MAEIRSKADFVDELFNFYTKVVDPNSDIVDMFYEHIDGHEEWVYVTYSTGAQKRFCVTCDNRKGILSDFNRFIQHPNDFGWLREVK